MSFLFDPDSLSQGVEVVITPASKTIQLVKAGNLNDDGVSLQCLYSFLKEEWKNDNTLIKFAFPMEAITPEQFELINGWDFADQTTKNLIRGGGWAKRNVSNVVLEEYMNITTLGSFYDTGVYAYYQQASSGLATNTVYSGPVNQAIKIYDSTGQNYRGYFKMFLRGQGQTYASYDLPVEQNISTLTYRKYSVPLSNSLDTKVSAADALIATGSTYTGITVTYYNSPVSRTIGASGYLFNIIVDGNNQDKINIYEKLQYLLRQNTDIDSGTGIRTGKLASDLALFVGDTLVGKSGLFIDNLQIDDVNNVTYVDYSGVTRTYPYVAAGTISFNSNLVADNNAKYWMFFNSVPSGDYGTANAVIVQDNNSTNITGLIGGQASLQFSFNYDGNIQGGRTQGTDAPVVLVAIGLSGAQYASATSTLTRSTANSISLVAASERNYTNP